MGDRDPGAVIDDEGDAPPCETFRSETPNEVFERLVAEQRVEGLLKR